jgi:diguanylate cyclase (GGDEF)-like protein
VRAGGTTLAETLPGLGRRSLPSLGDVTVNDQDYRVATFEARSFLGAPVRVSVLSDAGATSSAISRGRLLAVAVLVGFLVLAFAFAVAVSRSLQAQIGRFLQAARRLGGGDFSTAVPTEGRDEFAALGEEFNKMSRELERRLEELGAERVRLEESIRRVGETFASNLDSEALLEIVVRTAVDALGAGGGRASLREPDGRFRQQASAGRLSGFEEVIRAVESSALRSEDPEEVTIGKHGALAFPLVHGDDPGTVLGLVSVAREGRSFAPGERDLFAYLASQAAVSLENVNLHQVVQEQAVTDDLTGLSNHRRFQEVVTSEVERAKRFEQTLGLVMLDIDDFKAVNDTYGHQQGDLVLREVARALRASSREIDEPARYGGEELAVALPQTDLEGTYNLAERVRTAVEALRIPRLDGAGSLSITVSLGAAALPDCADGKEELIRVADEALYEAKHAGKNRTERAPARAARTVRAK